MDEEILERMAKCKAEYGKVIFASHKRRIIGGVIKEWHTKLPVVVVREATREEFIDQPYRKSNPFDDYPSPSDNYPYFYEVEALD